MSEKWFMAPFRHLLQDHRLWGIRRRWVVPAFATGAFIAFLPVPGHMLMAALSALALRVNIPVAALATWISNPVTVGPLYYFAYRLGAVILGMPQKPFSFEMSLDWVMHTLVNIWQPMLLGCLLLATAAALICYVGLDLLWRTSISNYKIRKQNIRRDKQSR